MKFLDIFFGTKSKDANRWCAFGESARGASHIRSGAPNQDAIGFGPDSKSGPPIRLAIADGHGSPKSFRSEIGSQFGVDAALEVMNDFLLGLPRRPDLVKTRKAIEDELPGKIHETWKLKVSEHFEDNPFLVDELDKAGEDGSPGRTAAEKNHMVAYGATVLAMLIHESFVACLQLGDGDILLVYDSGITVRPMEEDVRLFANETTSLSGTDSADDFRIYFQDIDDNAPALILAATDGYFNSFPSETGFWALGKDFLELLRGEGLETVEGSLLQWLEETTRDGCGDDITAGVLCRLSCLATA